jgi:hypothetical protein
LYLQKIPFAATTLKNTTFLPPPPPPDLAGQLKFYILKDGKCRVSNMKQFKGTVRYYEDLCTGTVHRDFLPKLFSGMGFSEATFLVPAGFPNLALH